MNQIEILSPEDNQGPRVIHTAEALSTKDYADHIGKDERTVKRWLAADELPEAFKNTDGHWRIPATAVRRPGAAGEGAALVHQRPQLGQMHRELSRAERLEDAPSFLTIPDAAEFLGVPQAQIVANPDVFETKHLGIGGALRVPKATIYKFDGGR